MYFIQLNLDLHDIRFYAAKSSIERTTKEKEKSASDRSRQKEELKQRNIYLYTILEEIKLRPTTTKKEELLYELKNYSYNYVCERSEMLLIIV